MPNPNHIVVHQHKLVFLLPPKVANSSVKTAILNATGQKVPIKQQQRHVHRHKFFKYVSTADTAKLKGYLKVGFVRNPWDRLVSLYVDKIQLRHTGLPLKRMKLNHESTFTEFVHAVCAIPDKDADIHFQSQWHQLSHNGHLVSDLLIYFESINYGWGRLQDRVATLKLPDLPVTNATQHEPYQNYYEDGLEFAVSERYANDIKHFGYKFA